jgi:Ca2+-transporting ATPase
MRWSSRLWTMNTGRPAAFSPLTGIFDIAGGIPLTPLQILWINFAVDVVLAIGLGFDAAAPGLMQRAPRDASAPVVDRGLAIRLGVASAVMAALALVVVAWGEDRYDLAVATTMGLTTLSLMHIAAALEVRELTGTIFDRYTIANRRFVQLIGVALALTFLVTELDPLQRIFDTVPLTSSQWGICLLGPSFPGGRGARKALDRHRAAPTAPAPPGCRSASRSDSTWRAWRTARSPGRSDGRRP